MSVLEVEQDRILAGARSAVESLLVKSGAAPAEIVRTAFAGAPVLQFPGFAQRHPLFGVWMGVERMEGFCAQYAQTVRVDSIAWEFGIVSDLTASLHGAATFHFPANGASCDLEFVAVVDLNRRGQAKSIQLYFDTATFLKAANSSQAANFRDVRLTREYPDFEPDSAAHCGTAMANAYMTFLKVGAGQLTWDDFYKLIAPDIEIAFKSNVDVIPYAGNYAGHPGMQKWFEDLLSTWSLRAFNFTKVIAQGNHADFAMHELHYYYNPDGTRRYLDVYIVQSWRCDADGRIRLFKSYNDSDWLDQTLLATPIYKEHYGYPASYGGLNGAEAAG